MTNTNDRVEAKLMPNGKIVMERIVEEQATVARNAQAELYEESQKILHNWYARRQKSSNALQQLATRVLQAKSPQEVITAWIDWSQHAITTLSEDFRDQWSLANKVVPNDVQEPIPVKVVLEVITPVPDVNGKDVKRAPKTKHATKAKQKPAAKQAPTTKPATTAKRTPRTGRHNIEHRSPSVAKKKPAPHHAVKLDKLVDEKLFAKLSAAGIERVGQVRKLTDAELKAVKGIGAKAIGDIRTAVS